MKKQHLIIAIIGLCTLISYNLIAQTYCIPPESTYGGPLTGFTNVKIGTLNNTSANDGYTDYTSSVPAVYMKPGTSYTPSFVLYDDVINQGFTDKLNLRIWIDLNIDGDFEDAGEQVFAMQTNKLTSSTNNNITGSAFTIPAGATIGTTRMRVYSDMIEADGHDTPVPCGYLHSTNALGQHGECEDYKVIISNSTGVDNPKSINSYNIFSNNEGNLVINYNLLQPANVVIEISNVVGQIISTVVSQQQNSGQYQFLTNKTEFGKGIYFVSLKFDNIVYIKKIVF